MTEPARGAVASYSTFREAGRAVDQAALHGAAAGALSGVLVGWIPGLPNWLSPVVSGLLPALYGLIFGAVVGALLAVLLHAAQGGRRNFAPVRSTEPGRYDVVADEDVADEAVRPVAGLDSSPDANTESASPRGRRPHSGAVPS
ncbi:hypothetical protein ACFQ9Z_11250 [Streptomyces sp. NPDC056580]|uniref:hypothetical protein n=1 Tax=Streptomyces sp. NPDC056580 TaxID=3345872 RepID=UPI0036887578